MALVYLGLGSNLGNREEYITKAIDALQRAGLTAVKRSTLIETEPVGGPPQGKFVNAVIEAHTDLKPEELLNLIQKIEEYNGRVRTVKDGPRTIDIDILLYDKLKISTENLTIPHPRMFERNFVLTPLQELNPTITQDMVS